MFLAKRVKQVAIGLVAMLIAMSTFGFTLSNSTESYFGVVRGLQLMATAALCYGVLKKDALDKEKFLLGWLAITTLLLAGLCRECIEILPQFIYYYPVHTLYLLELLEITAILGVLMYFIYQDYVALRQSSAESYTEIQQLLQTKDLPPAYIPTCDHLSVFIE